jgi:hypothetical protein
MWALILVLAVATGWSSIRLLPFSWHRLEALAASVAVGFVLAPWVFFVCAAAFEWRLGLVVGTGLMAAGVVVSLARVRRRLQFEPLPKPSLKRGVAWLAAGLVSFWMCVLAVSSYAFSSSAGGWFSNGNVWGDSPLHVALVTQFAHGDHLDLVAPYYKQIALTYPFMSDLWSGVLMRFTSNWVQGLAAPTLIMVLALLTLLYFAGRRLLNSGLGAWLAWYMFVFSGAFAGIFRVLSQLRAGQDYRTVMIAQGRATTDAYLNFFYSQQLPQRAYLFGMPLLIVAALVALELYRRRDSKKTDRSKLRLAGLIGGVLVGLMPLVHTHSFVETAGVLALATALIWWRERCLPAGWVEMLLVGVMLSVPQFVWQLAHSFRKGFSHWIFGWVVINGSEAHSNWLSFWLTSTGWLMVMILGGWYFLSRVRAATELWFVYVAGLATFVVCNLYVFQPNVWDNMKLFEYSFWFIMLASAAVFAAWWRYLWGKLLISGLMLSLCGMGFITIVLSGSQQNYQLLSEQEVQFGQHMSSALPANAYLLVGDRHNSPITMLADRKVVMTYAGWFSEYDGQWPQTYFDRQTMLQGGVNAAGRIHQYGANFAAFSDSEIYNEGISLEFFRSHYKLFDYESGWWVFDLSRSP